jgi:hypothetical protein
MDDSQVFGYVMASVADWVRAASGPGTGSIGSSFAVNAFDSDFNPGSATAWIDITTVRRGERISPGGGNYVEGKSGGLTASPRRGWIRRPLFHISALVRRQASDPYDARLRSLVDAIENALGRRFSIPFKEFSDPGSPTEIPDNRLRIRSFTPIEEAENVGPDGGLKRTRFELELEYVRLI